MRLPLPLLALTVLMLPFAPLSAATYYWDINGTATGATNSGVGDASGTWNGTNAFFNSNSTGTGTSPGTYVANNDVVFSAGTNATGISTITVGGGIAPGFSSLTINAGTLTFDSAGGALDRFVTRGTNTITLGAGAGGSATFNTVITASAANPDQTFRNQNATAGNNLVFNEAIRISGNNVTPIAMSLTLANSSAGGTIVNGSLGVRDDAPNTTSILALVVNNTGSGVTTLAGGNVYTGATTVRAGTLVVSSDAISTSLANQTYSRNASTFTLAGFNNGDRVVFNESSTQVPAGLTSGTVYYVVNQSGSTFQLSATPGGSAIVLTGTQSDITNAISKAGALGSTTSTVQLGDGSTGSNPVSLLVNGAHTVQRAISVNNNGTGTTLGGNSDHNSLFTGNITLNKTANLQSVTTGANSVTFSTGVISGSGGVNKTGSGTVTLSGANTYTGTTTISQGTLSASNLVVSGGNSHLGNATSAVVLGDTTNKGTLSYTGNTATYTRGFTVGNGGGQLDVTTSGQTLTVGTGAITGTAGLLTVGGAGNTTINSAITTGTGGLTKTGAGTLTLSNSGNSYTGLTAVSDGTLAYGASNVISSGAVTVNGGTLALGSFSDTVGAVTLTSGSITSSTGVLTGTSYAVESGSVSAILAGAVNLAKTTAGTVALTGANTYSGTSTLSAGVLQAGNDAAFGTSALVLNGGKLSSNSTSARTFANAMTFGSDVTLGDSTNNGLLTFNGLGNLTGNRTLTTASDVTYANVISGTGFGLTKAGAATLTLSGANSYTGGTLVSSGTLNVTGSLSDSGAVTVNGGTYTVGASDTVGAVTLENGTINGASTLTGSSYAVKNGAISAALAGGGALTKSTGGTVTLSGANSYTGDTIVSEGTLVLSGTGSIANSLTVDVASGAILDTTAHATYTFGSGQTLQGTGTIEGNSVVNGNLRPGNSPGVLNFTGDLTLGDNAISTFEIESGSPDRGVTYDGVNVSGLLTYEGTLTLSLTTLVSSATYNLFDNFTNITGNFDNVVFSGGAYTGTFAYSSGFWTATSGNQVFSFGLANGDLIISAIPEPSTTLLLTGGLMVVLFLRRRRV